MSQERDILKQQCDSLTFKIEEARRKGQIAAEEKAEAAAQLDVSLRDAAKAAKADKKVALEKAVSVAEAAAAFKTRVMKKQIISLTTSLHDTESQRNGIAGALERLEERLKAAEMDRDTAQEDAKVAKTELEKIRHSKKAKKDVERKPTKTGVNSKRGQSVEQPEGHHNLKQRIHHVQSLKEEAAALREKNAAMAADLKRYQTALQKAGLAAPLILTKSKVGIKASNASKGGLKENNGSVSFSAQGARITSRRPLTAI